MSYVKYLEFTFLYWGSQYEGAWCLPPTWLSRLPSRLPCSSLSLTRHLSHSHLLSMGLNNNVVYFLKMMVKKVFLQLLMSSWTHWGSVIRVFNKSWWPAKFASYFTWTRRLLFCGNYPSLNRVFMCCHWIKKPKFNDVCVLFKQSNFYSKKLEMYSERPRFQNFSRNLHPCCEFFPSPPTPKLSYLLKILLKTLIML